MKQRVDHFGAVCVAFAAASMGVWVTWFNYTWLGLRLRAPDWVLTNERLLVVAELVVLMVGALITAYRSGYFTEDPRMHPAS